MAVHPSSSKWLLAFAAMVVWFSSALNCAAQVSRYQPQTPTISPYLNLTRRNIGGLPNYYALVRPQIQQRSFNLQQQAQIRLQAGEIQRLERDVQRGAAQAAPTGTGSWFMTPGKRFTYLNTTSYYPAVNLTRRRQ